MNYSIQEYANDVVFHIQSVCDEAGVPHPELISESGRAIAAHHSILVMDTLGVTSLGNQGRPLIPEGKADQTNRGSRTANPANLTSNDSQSLDDIDDLPGIRELPKEYEKPVHDLWMAYQDLTLENLMESFHDAQVALDLCMNLFSGGYLPLEQRVAAENLYFALCHRVREISDAQPDISPELEQLDRLLSDIYFVNFSLFQSMPDAWAIDQLFPIMPIHRLDEAPTRPAVLGDITCDSDGQVDSFVGGPARRKTLKLHPLNPDAPYLMAVFMVGAYQEILGDLHNLFGDTHAVHVDCQQGHVKVRSIVKGDTISEVLGYVQYEDRELIERIQDSVEDAIANSLIDHQQAGQTVTAFENALSGYTYLKPVKRHGRIDALRFPTRIDGPEMSIHRPHENKNHEETESDTENISNRSPVSFPAPRSQRRSTGEDC